jgi:hypothetical protein
MASEAEIKAAMKSETKERLKAKQAELRAAAARRDLSLEARVVANNIVSGIDAMMIGNNSHPRIAEYVLADIARLESLLD